MPEALCYTQVFVCTRQCVDLNRMRLLEKNIYSLRFLDLGKYTLVMHQRH